MATVAELAAGDLVTQGGTSAVFIHRGVHPIWPALALVIWRLRDEFGYLGWSFDALDFRQEVGDVMPSTADGRQARLREILLGEGSGGG